MDVVLHALERIHSPSTKNEERLAALQHLESLKRSRDTDSIVNLGFSLSQPANQPLARHFGLSLLQHVICHQLLNLEEARQTQLHELVVGLTSSLDDTPEAYIRNKISSLWIELAKRTWALSWFDLDFQLVTLWMQGLRQKKFVLFVLEGLSADVFEREDSTAVFREKDLNAAVIEIFSAKSTFEGGVNVKDDVRSLRHGDEGWLARIVQYLRSSSEEGAIDGGAKDVRRAALSTLRSAFTWVMTPAIINADCMATVCAHLQQPDPDLVLAALDALNALYGRKSLEQVEVQALLLPLCQSENTAVLHEVYSWSVVGIEDVDSEKYTISKKIAELVSHMTEWIVEFAPPDDVDFRAYFAMLVAIAKHESLIVSIAAVHSWSMLMESSRWGRLSSVQEFIQPVLQIATQRAILYDQVPEDAEEPACLFVQNEIELHPERSGFYAVYRRFCLAIIDWTCYIYLDQALSHLLAEVDRGLDEIISHESSFHPSQYSRTSLQLLRADSQFTIVDAAFRGIKRWVFTHQDKQYQQRHQALFQRIADWSTTMLSQRSFQDPLITQRQIKHCVETANKILNADTSFAYKVLEHVLRSFVPLQPEHPLYSDATTELHAYASTELRRLALEHATYFATLYSQLEAKFSEIISNTQVDEKVQVDLKSTLFLIIQRADALEASERKERLSSFLMAIFDGWNKCQDILSSFEAFTAAQAFDQVVPYMARASDQSDWSSIKFDEVGVVLQRDMSSAAGRLPLRETRVLLSVSTERLQPDTEMHKMVCELWATMLPVILSSVLRLTHYSHLLHDPSNWPNATDAMLPTVRRIMRDRYWQSGISEGSMNEFYKKVKSTRATMEGLASSIRGRIRTNLENCYSIIHTLGRLGSHFYSMAEIPDLISQHLIQTATPLGLHHFGTLLSMLPKLIEECPPTDRPHFLPPVLSALLSQIDAKCTAEWQMVEKRGEGTTLQPTENLSDEMRDESVLRQMTYRAVNMVSFWLDPQRDLQLQQSTRIVNGQSTQSTNAARAPNMRDFILANLQIVEPLLVFCTHAIAYRDTKSCATMVHALQKMVPVYAGDTHLQGQEAAAVRDYISTEMLKATLTSFHDGYFADYQSHLATLIATIWVAYGLRGDASGQGVRQVMLSLPGMTPEVVDGAAAQLASEGGLHGKSKRLRAIVYQLLEDVRGVRLSELGKVDTREQQSKILERYRLREASNTAGLHNGANGDMEDTDLAGVADMFAQ